MKEIIHREQRRENLTTCLGAVGSFLIGFGLIAGLAIFPTINVDYLTEAILAGIGLATIWMIWRSRS